MYCDCPVLRRCCWCIPLRIGVLTLAYLNVLFSGNMVITYSYAVANLGHHSMMFILVQWLGIFIYALEIGFAFLLIYGTSKKIRKHLVLYYYLGISLTLASILVGFLDIKIRKFFVPEFFLSTFFGLSLQVYLIITVWSLIKKMDEDGRLTHEDQLNQVISGQPKADSTGVYLHTQHGI